MAAEHRTLRFESMVEAMAEVERLAAAEVKTTGQFSLGQILEHLARTLEIVLGKRELPKVALPMRFFARLMRSSVLRKASTGFKLPDAAQSVLWPTEPVSTEEGLARIRAAYEAFQACNTFPKHPFFGDMTKEQNHALQCRHFEGHLGFVHPIN